MQRTAYVIVALVLLHVAATAQVGYLWSFNERTSQSDLVVIAARVATRDTGIRTTTTDLNPPFPVLELNTEFKIVSVLKGIPPGDTLTLRHYRWDNDQLRDGVINGAHPLDFTTAGPRTEYPLFLKRDASGIFVPVSGQAFSGDSVFALHKAD